MTDTDLRTDAPAADANARRTLVIASLATLATFLDTTILYVAFPDIGRTFGSASAADLSWVLNAYTIVFAAVLIPAGKFADRFGHRRAMSLEGIRTALDVKRVIVADDGAIFQLTNRRATACEVPPPAPSRRR